MDNIDRSQSELTQEQLSRIKTNRKRAQEIRKARREVEKTYRI